jgi:hypothetical protein
VSNNFFIERLRQRFSEQRYITREELYSFYRSFEPDLKEATFTWRIYSLKEKNILKPVRTGVYMLSAKPSFNPTVEPRLMEIAKKVKKQFPMVKFCLWSTRWLSDWMIHQPAKFLIMVEVELSSAESVFYYLKDENYLNVYYNPDDKLLERYVYEEQESIIVKQLITKAPLKRLKGIAFPTPEKILVDLFIERRLFAPYQGTDLIQIFNTVYKEFTLNITKMLAYAKRRTKEQELIEFITNNTQLAELLNE